MKGITCCLDCAYYDLRLHKCTNGAVNERSSIDQFYVDCPLPDVAPVVQSNWIRLQHSGTIVCGNCGRNIRKNHGNDYADFEAFCPNCGAKMDGEKQ